MEIITAKQVKQIAIGYRFSTTKMKLAREMKNIINNLKSYLSESDTEMIGAPFIIYHNMGRKMDVTIGIGISKSIPENENYKMIEIDEGVAIEAIHKGSYMWLNRTYKKMTKYMKNNDLEPTYLAYEYYYNSPDEVKTKDLETKVVLYYKEK